MIGRRLFLNRILSAIAILRAPLLAQHAEMQNGKVVNCEDDVLTCPMGHKTCRNIDAPLVVGSDRNVDNPDFAELHNFHLERCNSCRVLFTRE